MPVYEITDPRTNKTLEVEGATAPTEKELEEIFAQVNNEEKPMNKSASFQSLSSEGKQKLIEKLGQIRSTNLDIAHTIGLNTYDNTPKPTPVLRRDAEGNEWIDEKGIGGDEIAYDPYRMVKIFFDTGKIISKLAIEGIGMTAGAATSAATAFMSGADMHKAKENYEQVSTNVTNTIKYFMSNGKTQPDTFSTKEGTELNTNIEQIMSWPEEKWQEFGKEHNLPQNVVDFGSLLQVWGLTFGPMALKARSVAKTNAKIATKIEEALDKNDIQTAAEVMAEPEAVGFVNDLKQQLHKFTENIDKYSNLEAGNVYTMKELKELGLNTNDIKNLIATDQALQVKGGVKIKEKLETTLQEFYKRNQEKIDEMMPQSLEETLQTKARRNQEIINKTMPDETAADMTAKIVKNDDLVQIAKLREEAQKLAESNAEIKDYLTQNKANFEELNKTIEGYNIIASQIERMYGEGKLPAEITNEIKARIKDLDEAAARAVSEGDIDGAIQYNKLSETLSKKIKNENKLEEIRSEKNVDENNIDVTSEIKSENVNENTPEQKQTMTVQEVNTQTPEELKSAAYAKAKTDLGALSYAKRKLGWNASEINKVTNKLADRTVLYDIVANELTPEMYGKKYEIISPKIDSELKRNEIPQEIVDRYAKEYDQTPEQIQKMLKENPELLEFEKNYGKEMTQDIMDFDTEPIDRSPKLAEEFYDETKLKLNENLPIDKIFKQTRDIYFYEGVGEAMRKLLARPMSLHQVANKLEKLGEQKITPDAMEKMFKNYGVTEDVLRISGLSDILYYHKNNNIKYTASSWAELIKNDTIIPISTEVVMSHELLRPEDLAKRADTKELAPLYSFAVQHKDAMKYDVEILYHAPEGALEFTAKHFNTNNLATDLIGHGRAVVYETKNGKQRYVSIETQSDYAQEIAKADKVLFKDKLQAEKQLESALKKLNETTDLMEYLTLEKEVYKLNNMVESPTYIPFYADKFITMDVKRKLYDAYHRGFNSVLFADSEYQLKQWGTNVIEWRKQGDGYVVKYYETRVPYNEVFYVKTPEDLKQIFTTPESLLYGEEYKAKRIAQIFDRMTKQPEGKIEPRVIGMQYAYDVQIPNVLQKIAQEYKLELNKITETLRTNDTITGSEIKFSPEFMEKLANTEVFLYEGSGKTLQEAIKLARSGNADQFIQRIQDKLNIDRQVAENVFAYAKKVYDEVGAHAVDFRNKIQNDLGVNESIAGKLYATMRKFSESNRTIKTNVELAAYDTIGRRDIMTKAYEAMDTATSKDVWVKEVVNKYGEKIKDYANVLWNQAVTIRREVGMLKDELKQWGNPDKIAVQRKINGMLRTPVSEAEIGMLKSITKDHAIGAFRTADAYFADLDRMNGTKFKDLIQRPMQTGEKFAKAELEQRLHYVIQTAKELKLNEKSFRNIMVKAIEMQEGGADVLKANKIKPVELSKAEIKMYNTFRDFYELDFNRLQEARINAGVTPLPKIENYFTFARVMEEMSNVGINPVNLQTNAFVKAMQTKFPYEKRTFSLKPLELNALGVFQRYSGTSLNYIYKAPSIAKSRELIEATWKEPIVANDGKTSFIEVSLQDIAPQIYSSLNQWLNVQAGLPTGKFDIKGTRMDRIIRGVTNRQAAAVMAFNIRVGVIQPSSWTGAFARLGKYAIIGAKEYLSPNMRKFIEKYSNNSVRSYDTALTDSLYELTQKHLHGEGTLADKATAMYDAIKTKGYWHITALDRMMADITWAGAYKKAITEGKTHGKAIHYANDIVNETQGSAAKSDISPIQTHAIGKALTAYNTFTIARWNMYKTLAKEYKTTPKQVYVDGLRLMLATAVVNSFFTDILGVKAPDPEPLAAGYRRMRESGDLGKSIATGVEELLQVLPVIGGAARYADSDAAGAVAQQIKQTMEIAGKVSGRNPTNRLMPYELVDIGGKWLGIPGTTQMVKVMRAKDKDKPVKEMLLGGKPEDWRE